MTRREFITRLGSAAIKTNATKQKKDVPKKVGPETRPDSPPIDHGLRLEEFHRVQNLGSQVIEPRKHQVIDIADSNPLGRPTRQDIELMPKGENFGLQGCAGPRSTLVRPAAASIERGA
jgi:hypothetical protein